jgi:8-oxoguanine deaminase
VAKGVLLKGAALVATMQDGVANEIPNADVLVLENRIAAIGTGLTQTLNAQLLAQVETVNVNGCLITPGLVNTHHHMYQSLTRAVPAAQDVELFGWLKTLYPMWARFTPEMFRVAAQVAMAELLLSGCTTSSDHQYLFPNGARLDDTIEAALDMGLRFTACRGSMSVGESAGGLPPDSLVETEAAILEDSARVIARWHDASHGAMTQIALAPCSPFSVSQDLMRETAILARHHGVRLHTHLAENDNDVRYSLERFKQTPAQYAESLGWVGADVWHAHCVKLDEEGTYLFARTNTGIAHCPCSNMRLASGIAPVPRLLAHGVPVGLGVDGSASNDGAHMLGEARQAMLLARVGFGPGAMTARTALRLATRGGAQVLGRTDIGYLAPGMMADLAVWDMQAIEYAGAQYDLMAALVFCAPTKTKHTMVNGQMVVRDGVLQTADLSKISSAQRMHALRLVEA